MASSTEFDDLGAHLGGDVVTLFVGPKRKKFVVHKQLLCKSTDFFDKGFNGKMLEAHKGEMHLPEDSPGAISFYINWLYRHKLPSPMKENNIDDLFDLYIFAEKVCQVTLQDDTVDTIQELLASDIDLTMEFLKLERLEKVFSTTDVFQGLSGLLIQLAAFEYCRKAKEVNWARNAGSEDIETIWQANKDNSNVLLLFLESLVRMSKGDSDETISLPWERDEDDIDDRCFFHRHAESHNCRPGKKTPKK